VWQRISNIPEVFKSKVDCSRNMFGDIILVEGWITEGAIKDMDLAQFGEK